ncbi:MAG: ankyrin repeat domain-containing protein [bacterium]
MKLKSFVIRTTILSLFLFFFCANSVFAVSKEEARRQLADSSLNYESATQAINCIKEGDINTLGLFIDAGMNVNNKYAGMPLIIYAFSEKQPEIAKLLIEKGANINTKIMGIPLLLYTIVGKEPEVAKLLIEKGVDPNTSASGESALYIAIYKNQPEIAVLLLKKGANPNKGLTYVRGYTPLRIAIRRNQAEVVKMLLEKNADITKKPLFLPSNIKLAHKKKYTEIEKLLVDYQNK